MTIGDDIVEIEDHIEQDILTRGRSIPISIFGPLLPYRAWPTPPPSMVWPRCIILSGPW